MAALIEPFFYCLLASLIWAPAVFLVTASIAGGDKNLLRTNVLSGKVWPAALVIAALPVLLAPVAATLGLSLRAPAPLPPMMEMAGPVVTASEQPVLTAYEAPSSVSLADILRMTAVLYFYGFIMLFALAAVRHIWFAYRLNYAYKLDEPRLEAELEAWRTRIGVKQRPRYVFSHIVSSVCVYGFFRPVIVMPMNLLDRISIEDAALMGAHEMAHIKRGDVVLFGLCSVAKAVFWFNPFMHQICARANLTAEQGADALVLARGVNRRQYAHCFVQGLRLAANARHGFAGELIPSFTPFDKRSRRQRLDAILSGASERDAMSWTTKLGLCAGAIVAACLAGAQAAFAVAPPAIEEALPVRPVKGDVTLGYGEKSKFLSGDRPAHEGIDLRAARGEPVYASGAGKVIAATDNYQGHKSWGNVVVVDHGHGLVTRYAHLDSYAVERGDRVEAGDVIGAVGSTGVTTGPHLHFEVISEGETIDPAPIAAPAPSPKARATMTRKVKIAPAPTALTPIEPVTSVAETSASASAWSSSSAASSRDGESDSKEHKLEKKLQQLEAKLRRQFDNFDAFDGLENMTVEFGDLELDGFDGAQDWAELFENSRIELEGLAKFAMATPSVKELAGKEHFTEEEIEAFREAQADAMEAAADAMENVKETLREQREARNEAMREMQEAARERAREQKEHEREMKRERKRHEAEMKQMRREAERDIAAAERDWASEFHGMISERELLEQREQALRNAKENLELELAEIERRRKELNKSE